MKYGFMGLGMAMIGICGIFVLMMFEDITVNNEAEYYVLKEAMEASMLEAIDITCFRSDEQDGCGGVVKISEQKFVENFTRRFAASISGDVKNYEIQFFDIIESPPKASVQIKGLTKEYEVIVDSDFSIENTLNGILEYNFKRDTKNERCPECEDLNKIKLPDIDTKNAYSKKEKKYVIDIDLSFI